MNWWEELAVSVVVAFLHNFIKNPTTEGKAAAVIGDIAALAGEAQAALATPSTTPKA